MVTVAQYVSGALLLVSTLFIAGCVQPDQSQDPASRSGTASLSGELTIYAAASLAGVFDEVAESFEKQNPGVVVNPITYDGSAVLATQLIEGARADIFASADQKNMARVTAAQLASRPVPFATNVLAIAVAPGNPLGIKSLADLVDATKTKTGKLPITVLCAVEVPCGGAAHTLISKAQVDIKPASEEQSVSAVLTKVKQGVADAGLVYVTDIKASKGAVTGVDIPGSDAATNVYPIVSLAGAVNPNAARAFVDYIVSDKGRSLLAKYGFGAP